MTAEPKRLDVRPAVPREGAPGDWQQAAELAELGVLSASLLHELRQPIFAIKANAQLGRVDDGRQQDRFVRILDQIDHVEDLLRYYGTLFRAEESAEPEAIIDLADPVRVAAETMSHRQRKVRADLALDVAPVRVRARALALRQVAINLIQNALDAVEGGAVRWIGVRVAEHDGNAVLIVEDSGAGVDPAVLDRVFDPFVTTKAPGRGTGLGLYIARRLVGEARGTLRYADRAEGGARFTVTLPLLR